MAYFKSCQLLVEFDLLFLQTCGCLGLIKLEPFSWKIVKLWYPVNLIFVGMICTSFLSLQKLGVPMATVLKNLTNLFTIGGDYFFYGKVYGAAVWSTLGLMALSALCGAFTDLEFTMEGYVWQMVNCLFTAAYSLYLRGVMDKLVTVTSNKTKLDEFSMIWYNNLLSLPLIAGLIYFSGEYKTAWHEPALNNPKFLVAVAATCLVAFGISFASLWFLSTTTATTYSLVGSLNKIPIAIIGLLAFNVAWTYPNLLSVVVGLVAGVIFVRAKQQVVATVK